MAINWRLKTFLSKKFADQAKLHQKVGDLQKFIKKKTGVIISVQNLSNYLNSKPKALPLKTMEVFCTAFDCQLSDLCTVTPSKKRVIGTKKLSPQNTTLAKRGVTSFPDPSDY